MQRNNTLPRKTDQKRKNMRGSRKLTESFCISRMHVKHFLKAPPGGKIEVTYISTHINHPIGIEGIKYVPLSLSLRKEVKEKFAQGLTLEKIMSGRYTFK